MRAKVAEDFVMIPRTCRLHLLTKHRVFSGPGFQLAQELGEVANGGQVLLSQEAWIRMRDNMFAAGFPVVEHLGLYKLNAWPVPICIYQVYSVMLPEYCGCKTASPICSYLADDWMGPKN